ncbi:MAG: DUF1427 family protein [Pyrinomonadaceae bacterium]
MLKLFIGVFIAFVIGAACRYFNLPVPAPPTIYGVLLIFAISLGYIAADNFLPKNTESQTAQVEVNK